jgi:hypothetical protein
MENTADLNKVVSPYMSVIRKFINRGDVQNGLALAYRKGQSLTGEFDISDKPKGVGDGLGTTGWCVSASQALLNDKIFKLLLADRGAMAKLVSIDIREQFHGYTYSGHQNKWHTAILVRDSGLLFIVDMTCRQFGNEYADKMVWDFNTWEKTFRSALDKHVITDFENEELSYMPLVTSQVNELHDTSRKDNARYGLTNVTTLTNAEKETIVDFVTEHVNPINAKILVGNISNIDYKYLDTINGLLRNLNMIYRPDGDGFHVMKFKNKPSAKNWVKKFLEGGCVTNQYVFFSGSINDSLAYNNMSDDVQELNKISSGDEEVTFIIIQVKNITGIDSSFIKNTRVLVPPGIKLDVSGDSIFNGGSLLDQSGTVPRKTNTIHVRAGF